MDVVQVIRTGHSELRARLDMLAATAAWEPHEATRFACRLAESFAAHHEAEEQLLFSRLRNFDDIKSMVDEAWEEHAAIDPHPQRTRRSHSSVRWPAKAAVLRELVEHHMEREETQALAGIQARMEDGLDVLGERFEDMQQKRAAAPLARLSVAAVSAVDHLTPIGVDHLATDV